MKKLLLTLASAIMLSSTAFAAEVTDVLTPDAIKLDGTSTYKDYTFTGESGAVYALQCSNGNSSIQLRSTNNAGIVTTKSAGTVKKVEVVWNSNTSSTGNRTLDIYGSSTAYTSAADLYSATTSGTKEGTITCGTATSLTFNSTASFVGLRSNNGAMYIEKISITWDTEGSTTDPDPETPDTPTGESTTVTFDSTTQGYTNAQDVTNANVNGVSFTFSKGSNNNGPKYYTTGTAIRLYGGNTMTVKVEGAKITTIELGFGSDDGTNAISTNVGTFTSPTWTGDAESVTFTIGGTSGHRRIKTVTVTYVREAGAKTPAGLSFSQQTVNAEGLDATGFEPTLTKATDADVTYTSSNEKVATVDATTGTVTLVAYGTTTITATAAETATFAAGTASYTLNVNPGGVLTVAEALAFLEGGNEGEATVKGIISKIDELNTSFGNATYFIKDDLNDEKSLEIYRGYWLNGDKFTAGDEIAVGGTIEVSGKLVNFNGTYEFTTGSKVVSYTAPEGDEPEQPEQPGDDTANVSQPFTTGLGFPEAKANTPTEPTEYTATDTEITYTIYGCYVNSGYILLDGKNNAGAYISFALDFNCKQFIIKTSSGCSVNDANTVNIYADGNLVEENFAINVQNGTFTVDIPEEYQAAGTVYKIESASTSYNGQIASLTYVKAEESDEPEQPGDFGDEAIEGEWKFTLNDHYLGEYSLGEFTESFTATLEGNTVRFESSGSQYDIVAEFTAENTLTFNKAALNDAAYVLTQVPYVNTTGIDDLDDLEEAEKTFTATFDPEAGTITFPANSGLLYGFFASADGTFQRWENAFDFAGDAVKVTAEKPEITIGEVAYNAYPDQTVTFTVPVTAVGLEEGAEIELFYRGPNEAEFTNEGVAERAHEAGVYEFTIGKLELNTEYTVEIYAKSGDVQSEVVEVKFRTYNPNPEANITAVEVKEVTETSATITVGYSTNLIPADAKVYITATNDDDEDETFEVVGEINTTATAEILLENLTPGTDYSFTIAIDVLDEDGESVLENAAYTRTVTFTTTAQEVAPSVTITKATAENITGDTLDIVVEYTSDNLPEGATVAARVMYEITEEPYRVVVEGEKTTATTTKVAVTGLEDETEYTFLVSLYIYDAEGNIIGGGTNTETVTATTTGIASIEADGADVRYFNLQGVELQNPAAGTTVIRVQGNTATKVLVK